MMTARTRRVHADDEIVTRRTEGDAVADEHTFTLTIEASGEVTPAPQREDAQPDTDTDTTEPEPEEAEQ